MSFDLDAYLRRIGLPRCDPSAGGLRRLVEAQMRTIPFENIDPMLGIVPDLSPDAVFRKLVAGGRGGYCFELNGLLGLALKAIGLPARPVLGRVRLGRSEAAARLHLAWVVTVDGEEWLADAGFGGPGPAGPVRLAPGAVQEIGGARYRLQPSEAGGELVLERRTPESWFALFSFDDAVVLEPDIEAANFYCALSERLPFRGSLMLSIHREGGRASLFNTSLAFEPGSGPDRSARRIASADELGRSLEEVFGLRCGGTLAGRVWERLRQQ